MSTYDPFHQKLQNNFSTSGAFMKTQWSVCGFLRGGGTFVETKEKTFTTPYFTFARCFQLYYYCIFTSSSRFKTKTLFKQQRVLSSYNSTIDPQILKMHFLSIVNINIGNILFDHNPDHALLREKKASVKLFKRIYQQFYPLDLGNLVYLNFCLTL